MQQLGLSYGDGFNAGQKTKMPPVTWPKEKVKFITNFQLKEKLIIKIPSDIQ